MSKWPWPHLPREVRINGAQYRVRREDLTRSDTDQEAKTGRCDVLDQEIGLRRDLKTHLATKTFLHEIIEAINSECGLGLQHDQIIGLDAALARVAEDNAWTFGGKTSCPRSAK